MKAVFLVSVILGSLLATGTGYCPFYLGFPAVEPAPAKPLPYFHRQNTVIHGASISAYTASIEECGKDDGIGASGVKLQPGHVAMDGVPFGTKVIIEEVGIFEVQDRFGGGYGLDRVDIFMLSKSNANNFGRQSRTIHIIGK